ncbi:LysR family transcriptional regulator [Gulosibacter molinativorax]|uniref:LysR family transcriptional regulator n=1 Tax=Gulosibacter molinativorax TaxID=256821 RepID=A0ABT7C5D3_9MICO|nr:LysR family transcriptional regulator [Gulosibacter molinativorax]MDJ1370359.1 LysR family transcriptional regulator [Gulosibacter molinativorax]QUY61272.1 Transcriptional regulator, LysR family [Gulosibacter molinativorax]
MELRHLRYFTAVVESGSFTAAAAALHISQPPLSVAIAKLEAEAGVQLLQRSHRGVEPTSAGRYLLDAASRVLAEMDDMVETLGRFGSGMAGTLRLAVVPVLMWHRLPRVLRAFADAAPQVEVSIVDPPPWTAVEMLERGTVDLAAIMVAQPERFIARHRGSYDILEWGEIPLVGVLPPRTRAQSPLPLTWFEGRNLVLPDRTAAVPSLPESVEAALRAEGVHPSSMRTSETIQTCLPLIEAGLAEAILPDPDRASLARFDVEIRELDPAPVPLTALALTRKGAAGANSAVARILRTLEGDSTHDFDQH